MLKGCFKKAKLGNFALLLLAVVWFAVPNNVAVSQAIDPALLQSIGQQNRGQENSRSALDQAREDAEVDELEEKAREEAIKAANEISAIEEDYTSRSTDDLTQYGYDIFQSVSLAVNASVGRVPANYMLGVGDQLIVSFVGSNDRSINTVVDSEGRVILPDLSPINAVGRSFAEFEADLHAIVEEAMIGTKVYVSVANVRQIGVYVLGEVSMPGLHNMTSLSSVLQALAKAGGVKKTGSLRAIEVEYRGVTKTFDLYKLMQSSAEQNIALQDGARIIVPTIGKTIAVDGKVARPAIYELAKAKSEINWRELLGFAGGTIRPRGNDFKVNRFEENGNQSLSTMEAVGSKLLAGDLVTVDFKRDAVLGEVFLTGHVQVEGSRPLAANPTLSSLISGANVLGPTPYMAFAVVETVDEKSKARFYSNVNLERVLLGLEDVELKDKDKVLVYSYEDISFLSSSVLRGVVLTGNYDTNECSSLTHIANFVNNFGRDRFAVLSRNIFVDATSQNKEEDRNRKRPVVADAEEEKDVQEDLFNADDSGVIDFTDVVDEGEKECLAIYEDNQGILAYTLEHVASINGSVRVPGLYPVSSEVSLSSVVASAGGFSRDADLRLIEILQVEANQNQTSDGTSRLTVDAQRTNLDDVIVKSNYSIRANAKATDQESGTVLLSGEFARPGVYTITKGETLSQLIERAGGTTRYAYPIGAIFTRLSAKASQEASFKRASREIDNALAVAAIRSDVDAASIVAAQNLSYELTTIEALGRVVVEADISVLRVRPELDTVLEPGDKLVMPKRPNFVMLGGDVLNPGALQFISGKTVDTYLTEAGGIQRSADESRIFLVHPNGVASPIKTSRWGRDDTSVLPGSTIIVPKNLDPLTTFELVTGVTQILSQLALSAASIAVISN